MDYSIYKDDSVLSTVEKIQKILNDVGIELEEIFFNVPTAQNHIEGYNKYPSACDVIPYSSRVALKGFFEIGTNGKGTTKENCRASAYSEFMERLQNQYLPKDILMLNSEKFCLAPDEKELNQDAKSFLSKYNYTEIFYISKPKKNNNLPLEKFCIPYFNLKDNKLHYLPSFHFLFSTNGMSAGNSPEEALVQGFSEVCERFANKCVTINKIAMPDIPKKYYEKYEKINSLINYAEQLGWKVHIKDASLGMGLPVICTIFENIEQGVFSFDFGSQPSLPVAIERTLTEFFQGGVVKDCDLKNKVFHIKNYSEKGLKHVYYQINYSCSFFSNSEKIYNIFFNKKTDYKFSPSSWVNENKKYTNKELLKFIVDKITKVTDNDIYVRDVSFLGFPAYHIFIPQVTETIYYDNDKINLIRWYDYDKNNDDSFFNIDSLISVILFRLKYLSWNRTIAPLIPDEYLLILCYIIKDDAKNVIKYCEILKNLKEPDFVPDFVSKNLNLIDIIYHYYSLKQQKERPATIKNILNNMHEYNNIQEFYSLLKNLNFEFIKNKIYDAIQDENKIDADIQEDISKNHKITDIKQKLIQKYIENTPDQMELKKVFDFSDIKSV